MCTKYCTIFLTLFFFQQTLSCVFLKLPDGVIKGRLAKIPDSNRTFYAFQQIPFAAPPVGNLRFQPPQPVQKWKNILDATQNTKICYQMGETNSMENEDCLYLNVYTPKLPSKNDKDFLPVMVYIHGGGFQLGDSSFKSYGPEFLVDQNVIIVTMNYRLGPFGFLSTQDKVIPGNYGLKDQLFALKWVKENIHLFSGNTVKITLFGQSAGASSVGYHLLNKNSKGLFRAAIMESGSALSAFAYQRNARYYAIETANRLNSSVNSDSTSEEIYNTLVKVSAADIDKVSGDIQFTFQSYDNIQLMQGYYFAPVIEEESKDAFVTEKMFEFISKGEANRVPIIIGMNSEEGVGPMTDLNLVVLWMALYDNDLRTLTPRDMNIESEKIQDEVGAKIRKLYTGDKLLLEEPAAGIRLFSDISFTKAIIKHAKLQASFSSVFFYQFSYDGNMGNVSVKLDGHDSVGHNEELAYLWRLQTPANNNLDLSMFPKSDITTHKRLLALWTNFAKTLNPTPRESDLLQNIKWPTVEPNTEDFSYLDIGENLVIQKGPRNNSFPTWENLYMEYGKTPFDSY